MPPALVPPIGSKPSAMVRPERLAVTPLETHNTSTALLPLIVTTLPAGGLSISSGPAVSVRSSVLDSVIVCGVAAVNTIGLNWISLPAVLVLALAWEMQKSRSPASVPVVAPVSLVRSTV